MTFEQAVERWLRVNGHVDSSVIKIGIVDVVHEDGAQIDMTYWPSTITIKYRVLIPNKHGNPTWRKRETGPADGDPTAFMRELFALTETESDNA